MGARDRQSHSYMEAMRVLASAAGPKPAALNEKREEKQW